MINDMIAGMETALKQVRECPVYAAEQMQQGTASPYFSIELTGVTETPRLYPRFYREHPFLIRYSPEHAGNCQEMHQTAEGLYSALAFITGPSKDKYHGTKLRHEIVEGALCFFVNYNVHISRTVIKETEMGELKIENK